ncbi:MAG: HAD family hydrolase [Elusimicrobiales bacterium]
MNIKYIFFDYGGTIDSNGRHWRERFYDIYKKNGIEISYEDFSKAFFDSDDNLPLRHNLKDKGFEETVILQVKDVFNYLKINDEKKISEIAQTFINESKKQINENIKVFNELKKKGIKLAIISNFYGNLNSVLYSLGILNYFDSVADSGVIGHIKPEKEIFDWALKSLNAKTESSAMVGDAAHRDIKGAHDIGMIHFYLTSKKENEIKKCCEKLIIIKELKDLIGYV